MNGLTFAERTAQMLKDPRAGLLPATLKSLFADMAAALDAHEGRLNGHAARLNQVQKIQSEEKN